MTHILSKISSRLLVLNTRASFLYEATSPLYIIFWETISILLIFFLTVTVFVLPTLLLVFTTLPRTYCLFIPVIPILGIYCCLSFCRLVR